MVKFACLILLLFGPVPVIAVALITDAESIFNVIQGKQLPRQITEDVYKAVLSELTIDELLFASHERVSTLMDGDMAICTPYRLKTEAREKKYLFSLPTDFFFGRRLYQYLGRKPPDARFLDENGEIKSIVDMLSATPNYTLLIGADHSYGDFLDREITRIPRNNLYVRYGIDPYYSMIKMLAKGRVDFYLSYPSIINNSGLADALRSYGVAGLPRYEAGHLMCNDHAESKRFLAKFNEKLLHLYRSGHFIELSKAYLAQVELEKLKVIVRDLLSAYQQRPTSPK